MRILVTGGAGFIGSHIVDACVESGHKVFVVDDLSTGGRDNLNPGARFHRVSITDAGGLARVFEEARPQVVNHHAALASVRNSMSDPVSDAMVNVLGSLNVLRGCVKHEVERIIFSSTCAVYDEPRYLPMDEVHALGPGSVYGASKLAAESYVRLYSKAYGIKHKIFRYGNVFGPRQDPKGEAGVIAIFTDQFSRGVRPTIFGDGSKTRDYVFVSDIVAANVAAMGEAGDNETFNLAGARGISDFQIFEATRTATASSLEPRYAARRPGEADAVSLDISKAKRILGWQPDVSLIDGIGQAVTYYRQAHGDGA